MKVSSEQEMMQLGEKLAGEIEVPAVIELVGDVGTGKTTLTRGLAKGLGVTDEVTSPSFMISKSYACSGGRVLTHYDFYRLGDPGIMMEDLEEKLRDPGQVVVVEWGESVEDVLPERRKIVNIVYNDDGTREVNLI